MLACFAKQEEQSAYPLYLVTEAQYASWCASQASHRQQWLIDTGFAAKAGQFTLLTSAVGSFEGVLLILTSYEEVWPLGALPLQIPLRAYQLIADLTGNQLYQALTAWGLGAYQFTDYKDAVRQPAQLCFPKNCQADLIQNVVESIYLVRDLINIPTEEMGPLELAEVTVELGTQYQAKVRQIVDEELLDEMYPAIFTVGRASDNAPRLIDLQWGKSTDPKVTLVGKGVCFDSGGLDLKSAEGMRWMKKDMGGAAHVLGLARMIMEAKLPVRLRVLIPAVENAIGGNAYRPGDVIAMRNGKTVEIDNTDAEGRLILADSLVEACQDRPQVLMDFATLTGAARVAVGPEVAALFTNDDQLAEHLLAFSAQDRDPIWRLPLHQPYLSYLKSNIADLVNSANTSYGGAITAALFLQQFVDADITWAHFDIMAFNLVPRPGHPEGGEAMALRAVFNYLRQRFSSQH